VFSIIIQTENLDLLGQPMPAADQAFLDLSIDKMNDIEFSYEIGLAPKVDFDFLKKAAPFTHYKVAIQDSMVNEEVDRLRKRFASYEYPEDSRR
jgi:FKBP-type peptidyl-prolyl cis-trans isomerase (trigger factor)